MFKIWLALLLMSSSAMAEVVVVAAANSPLPSLSKEQINAIYLNKLRQLPSGEVPIALMLSSGPAKEEFFAKVLERSDAQAKAYWARLTFTGKGVAPREFANEALLKKQLLDNPFSIGYIDKAALDGSLKIILSP